MIPVEIRQRVVEQVQSSSRPVTSQPDGNLHMSSLEELNRLIKIVLAEVNLRTSANEELLNYLLPFIDWIALINGEEPLSKTIAKFPPVAKFEKGRTLSLQAHLALRRIMRRRQGMFDSNLAMLGSEDAIHISSERTESSFTLHITSINETGLDILMRFLLSNQQLATGLQIKSTELRHSSRVALDPFLAAVDVLSRKDSGEEFVPVFVRESLSGALRYYYDAEWRTSVVLSAIALETLLAEMFEEELHVEAPDIPLGALKDEIKKRILKKRKPKKKSQTTKPKNGFFPKEIESWIDKSNSARIAAVHRGSRQLSAKEAFDAIRGLVTVSFWYYHFRKSAPEVV
jgi:hypothetical protein